MLWSNVLCCAIILVQAASVDAKLAIVFMDFFLFYVNSYYRGIQNEWTKLFANIISHNIFYELQR